MRRRHYLAAAVTGVLAGGCLDEVSPSDTDTRTRTGEHTPTTTTTDTSTPAPTPTDEFVTPSPTDPVGGTFETPDDSDRWTVELGSLHSLYTGDDVYPKTAEEGVLNRITPDGSHEWQVDTDERTVSYVSGGSTLYHKSGPRHDERLVARAVETGEERWAYDTWGRTLTATDSAVYVGEAGDDLSTGGASVFAVDAESGDRRWENSAGSHSKATVTDELCLVPNWRGTLSAFDVTTGGRRWEHVHDSHGWPITVRVVGDTAYFFVDYDVAAYSLPEGDELWRRRARPRLRSIAAAPSGADRADAICLGGYEGTLRALDPETGETTWAIDTPFEGRVSSMVRAESTVVVAGEEMLYGYDVSSGEERWRQDVSPIGFVSPWTVIDGALVGTSGTEDEWQLLTFDVESGERRWRRSFEGLGGSGIADGRIVVGTEDGTVYGFTID